jgi:hypothetical protein
LCLAGALVEVGLKLLRVGMDHNGSLNTSFLPDIRSLSLVVTDTIRDDRLSIEGVITNAGNLEPALLRTGFKDLFTWVLPIIISLMKIVHFNCIISNKTMNNPKSGV